MQALSGKELVFLRGTRSKVYFCAWGRRKGERGETDGSACFLILLACISDGLDVALHLLGLICQLGFDAAEYLGLPPRCCSICTLFWIPSAGTPIASQHPPPDLDPHPALPPLSDLDLYRLNGSESSTSRSLSIVRSTRSRNSRIHGPLLGRPRRVDVPARAVWTGECAWSVWELGGGKIGPEQRGWAQRTGGREGQGASTRHGRPCGIRD